jgi:hypothetical protein
MFLCVFSDMFSHAPYDFASMQSLFWHPLFLSKLSSFLVPFQPALLLFSDSHVRPRPWQIITMGWMAGLVMADPELALI